MDTYAAKKILSSRIPQLSDEVAKAMLRFKKMDEPIPPEARSGLREVAYKLAWMAERAASPRQESEVDVPFKRYKTRSDKGERRVKADTSAD